MAVIQSVIQEGNLQFQFPANAVSTKYDEWSFYRNQFNSAFGGTKAVDIVFVDDAVTWLIEIKDYRVHSRTKSVDIGEEISLKVRDTLAGLVAAKNNANDTDEKNVARQALKKNKIRVVLHLEQPATHSKLFPKAISPANAVIKLKQLLKPIDAHPQVVDKNTIKSDMNWSVH